MNIDKWIGDTQNFPIEHRMLNIVMGLGIVVACLDLVFNLLFDYNAWLIRINGVSISTLFILRYLSMVKKQFLISQVVLIGFFGFIIIPTIWTYNNGIAGWAPYLVILYYAAAAVLLRGFWRSVTLIGFTLVMLGLMAKDYYRITNAAQYSQVFLGMIITSAVIVTFFVLILNYYVAEKNKAQNYRLQLEKKNMEIKMARLDRLDMIGEMAASIGHEVRNPLTTVRGFLQFYQQKKEYQQHGAQFGLMIGELDRANEIITEFLSLAKNRTVLLKPLDLNEVIHMLYPLMYASSVSEDKEFILALGDVSYILADENQIKQLILNLVRNAREAVVIGGKVTLATYMQEGKVILAVKDNGRGIPPDIYNKLGTPFVTTKEKGTGLGLAICYKIIETHHADMKVETSELGTEFLVKFLPDESAECTTNT